MGYVPKIQSNEDKRVFHVSLNETTIQLVETKYKALQEYTKFIYDALNKDEIEQFKNILAKLVMLYEKA